MKKQIKKKISNKKTKSKVPKSSETKDTTSFKKFDQGKVPLSILTRESLEAEAKVFAFGAEKYDRNNYKKGTSWNRLLDSTLRHVMAFNDSQDMDEESKMNHLWHAKACLAMLIYYYENKLGTDDRYKKPKKEE